MYNKKEKRVYKGLVKNSDKKEVIISAFDIILGRVFERGSALIKGLLFSIIIERKRYYQHHVNAWSWVL